MKIQTYLSTVVLLIVVLTSASFAQGQSYVSLEYQLGFPGATMNDFVEKPAYSGFSIDFAELITPYIGLGGSFSWNNFYQEWDRDIYEHETIPGAYYVARRWRQIDAMPVLFKTYFIYENAQTVVPFASLGMGAYFMRSREIVGPLSTDVSSTHFGLRPEIGTMFMFEGVGIRVSGAFNGVFKNSSRDASGMSHFNLGLGVTFSPNRM